MKKILTALSFVFATFAVPQNAGAAVVVPVSSAATTANNARMARERAAAEKLRDLVANPAVTTAQLTAAIAEPDYKRTDFDRRDLPFLAAARKTLYGSATRKLDVDEAEKLIAAAHRLTLKAARDRTLAALRNPQSRAADIRRAMQGYQLFIFRECKFALTEDAAGYIDTARKAVMGGSPRVPTDAEIVKMVDFMVNEDAKHDFKVAGIAVGAGVALYAGLKVADKVSRRRNHGKGPRRSCCDV